MTRSEAIKKVDEIWAKGIKTSETIVEVYEALGMIKFDEEKKEPVVNSHAIDVMVQHLMIYNWPHSKAEDIIKSLALAGYKIVKDTK